VLFNLGLGSVQAGVAATLFPSISLTTAAGGMVWFSERLSLWQLAGGVLILGAAGAVAVSLGARETASPTSVLILKFERFCAVCLWS
jgi:drug/metabolite transporter (DMT)-like permease